MTRQDGIPNQNISPIYRIGTAGLLILRSLLRLRELLIEAQTDSLSTSDR
jgi:hypothetical protein